MLNLCFTTVSRLRDWLETKNHNSNSSEEFYQWLQDFFESGNTITVHNEEYDYWACWELV